MTIKPEDPLGIGTAQLHISITPWRSALYLTNDIVCIESNRPVPGAWVRFWHRVLLGWRWEAR